MSISLFGRNHESLIKELTSTALNFKKRKIHNHQLWILTCYINIDTIREIADHINAIVKLEVIYVAFDISEVYKEDIYTIKNKFSELIKYLLRKNITLEYVALDTNGLAHAKGYALYQNVNNEINDGVVITTSANLTNSGFMGKSNIEIGYKSTAEDDLSNFVNIYNELWRNYGISGVDLKSAPINHGNIEYLLLQGGVFLHKWDGSISQQIGLRYYLTENTKQRRAFINKIDGIDIEAEDTITHRVLKIPNVAQKALPRTFIRQFTIDTNWGRWCPLDFWRAVIPLMGDFKNFQELFKEHTTNDNIELALENARPIQAKLISEKIIRQIRPDSITQWKTKITTLRNSDSKLERLFTGYTPSKMPFDISNTSEISRLFETLMETIDLSNVKNTAMKKFLFAYENMNPIHLQATEEDRYKITASRKL